MASGGLHALIRGIRRVKPSDIRELWKLPVAAVSAPFYRLRHPDLWIVCEDPNEARDNGYWFFKYVREHHPEQDAVYAIHRTSVDFPKVATLGRTVEFGSLAHWIQYLASTKKVSSQKAGNPNAAIFYALEVYGILRNKRIFLQHGITINDARWLYYDVTKMSLFICGSTSEYDFVRENFGYPKNSVMYTGFCRFDNLHNSKPDENLVLIMPSWREWIADEDYRLMEYEGSTEIQNTNYFKHWTSLIQSKELRRIAAEYGVHFIFFPHRNMQKYLQYFPGSNDYLQIAAAKDWEVQELLKRAALLITDYSSVFFDFVYMKKPVLFYQFDYEQFRQGQYGEGWFDYRHNAYSHSFQDESSLLQGIEEMVASHYETSNEFAGSHSREFRYYDQDNCCRVYDAVHNLGL